MAQSTLGAAGVRRVWAGAGLQRTGVGAYRGVSGTVCYHYCDILFVALVMLLSIMTLNV